MLQMERAPKYTSLREEYVENLVWRSLLWSRYKGRHATLLPTNGVNGEERCVMTLITAAKEIRVDGVVSSFSLFKRVLTSTMKHFVCS